jgi:hypothetical protein
MPTKGTPVGNEFPKSSVVNNYWIARSTVIGDWVERLHDFTCQICGTRLVTPAGACAEMCQIKPLRTGPTSRWTFFALAQIAMFRSMSLALLGQ